MAILDFSRDILKEHAFLMGLIAMIGLLALKSPGHKVSTGTLGPISGYLMFSAGADVISGNLTPLPQMIETGFNIRGVVPNNEAVTSVAQELLGVETMSILILGLVFNVIIARFTRYKYVFLTGHHSFFMACLLSAVLGAIGFEGWQLILIGGFFLGSWSAISSAIGSLVGKNSKSTEDIKVPEKWSFLRNTTISTALTMVIFYLIAAIAAGPDYVSTISDGTSPYIFAMLSELKFAVGLTIVYVGVRMILADLIPAFQGIATKIIPNAVPAADAAVFFPYHPQQ